MFATRSLVLVLLLAAMAGGWWFQFDSMRAIGPPRQVMRAIEPIFYCIIAFQVFLVMVTSPAAAASSFIQDKLGGRLQHLLTTDLSNGEIILGKLTGRALPLLSLVFGSLPLLCVGVYRGVLEPMAPVGAYLVSVAVAVLGCTLGLALSVWARRIQEALLGVYLVWVAAVTFHTVWGYASSHWAVPAPPSWLRFVNPVWLAVLPFWAPGRTTLIRQATFLVACLAVSAIVAATATKRLRTVAARQESRPTPRAGYRGLAGLAVRIRDWLPGPSLERNPILWREWRRSRPSRTALILWGTYGVTAIALSLLAIWVSSQTPFSAFPNWVCGAQVTLGLLLLSVSSVTTLADERKGLTRLEVILATPLPTQAIVEAKWWSAFRLVCVLPILPALVAAARVYLVWGGGWLGVALVAGLVFAQGALITTFGLALAVWVRRGTTGVAVSMIAFFVLSAALLIPQRIAPTRWWYRSWYEGLGAGSPIGGAVYPLSYFIDAFPNRYLRMECLNWVLFWTISYTLIALVLLVSALASSDRCLGRLSLVDAPPVEPFTLAAQEAATRD
jgi:hypothetical protein